MYALIYLKPLPKKKTSFIDIQQATEEKNPQALKLMGIKHTRVPTIRIMWQSWSTLY